ncbi:hypothetical protein REPUB_Repub03eG0015100 [Reevesia pubescens]
MAAEKRSTLNKELLFLILQFCKDEGYKRTAHMFERESGCFFNMEFFEDMVLNGKWNKVEKHLSGFTNVNDNKYSTKIYFEIRKLKFLEALDNNDRAKALDILMKDLKVFAQGNEELFREMTQLLTLDDFRENELLSMYGDAESSRKVLMVELKKLIEANPVFHGKLKFPSIKSQRLRRLINQGLNWQHIQCKYPQSNPDVGTLFEDHVCQWEPNHFFMQSAEMPLPSQDASVLFFPTSWISGPCTVAHAVSNEDICLSGPIALATTSNNTGNSHTMSQKSQLAAEDEIDAHVGGVNDLAFSTPNKELVVITAGDDKIIKVWDVITGVQMHNLEGHEAPVYSLYPHCKEDIQLIFSTSVDGKIKAWLYDNLGARFHFDAPGLACTTMAYGADNRRLFSCGTNKNGESFIVEWNESEAGAKRTYQGLCKNSSAVVQFAPIKEKFLAAADDHVIKIWDMDKVELLTTIDAEGGLPANPHIRSNKEGTLLAVIASENKIKILATNCGLQLLNASVNAFVDSSSDVSNALRKNAINPSSTVSSSGEADGYVPTNCDEENLKDVKNRFVAKASNKSDVCRIVQISRPNQCQLLQLSGCGKADKISRLIYTNAGNALLALASNATHLLWKWPKNDLNLSGKATTNIPPQLWQPRSCSRMMTNDLTGSTLEEALPCLVLSKNDSYLLSASGGMISLFNMLTFKMMMSIMPPSPAATSLAIHPQDNNIVAIGMDDSTILIYNVRLTKAFTQVKSKLKGHSGRVTGLAFSNAMNMLVSSGTDAQIFTWDVDSWERCTSKLLELPDETIPVVGSNTQVQFHLDQVHFLVVHETQLSIYEAKELACVQQWVPEDSTRISQATFSCHCEVVYACLIDGTVSIFGASDLELKCQIIPTAYLPSSARLNVYPISIAAHPQIPDQFALGLTDGGIIVF